MENGIRVVAAVAILGWSGGLAAETVLQDQFANLSQWKDLSTAITWGGQSAGTSAFVAGSGVDASNAALDGVTLSSTALANISYTSSTGLKTFTALDRQFAAPINHATNIVKIDFRVRWKGTPNNNGEANRFIVTLTHDYPAGGLDLTPDAHLADFTSNGGAAWARPAYHARIRGGSQSGQNSWLQYGGGKMADGEFETYNDANTAATPDWWLPGFISGAGGSSPGSGPDFPTNSWTSSNGPIASTSYQDFHYIISPDKQELFVGNSATAAITMNFADATNSSPYYEYFPTFEGIRLYWRGADTNQAILDSLSVNVTAVPEPAGVVLLGLAGVGLLRRRRTGWAGR